MHSGKTPDNRSGFSDTNPRQRLASYATAHAVRRQRRVWSGRVASWDQHGSAGLTAVTAAVLAAADVGPGDQVVDLGCGNGQLSLPLVQQGGKVLAVDVSPAMVRRLQGEARLRGAATLDALALPIEQLVLPACSIDLVVSSYALHHLRDADKARLVSAACCWLKPGGRLIIADMMIGRGGSRRDRAIIRAKVRALACKGPGGWWRIAKNTARYLLRVQERPVSMDSWITMLNRSGFTQVTGATIVAEAGLVSGCRPGRELPGRSGAGGADKATRPGQARAHPECQHGTCGPFFMLSF